MCWIRKVDQQTSSSSESEKSECSTVNSHEGRYYSYFVDKRTIGGLIALVIGAVMLIFAVLFASSLFGGAKMSFVAGGLTIASMACFATAAFLLVRPLKSKNVFT